MDYKVDDETKFNELVEKTSWFAELAGEDRILIRSNAMVFIRNTRWTHLRHMLVIFFPSQAPAFCTVKYTNALLLLPIIA